MKYETNALQYYAEKYLREEITEEEILTRDVTQLTWGEIEQQIKHGEIIIININAKTRTGKTTAAFAIAKKIHDLLKKHRKTQEKEFTLKNILRDQQELSKAIRDPKANNTIMVIDEWNDMETTGENSSIEQQLIKQFSDIQAARYIHRIWCSPKELSDNNADIILEIIARDTNTLSTHVRVYYRLFKGGIEYTQIIGYMNIEVKEIIETWEKEVKNIFYKYPRTTEEEQKIREIAEKDMWTKYNLQKHAKIDLLTKEGVFKPRILEYAEMIKETIQELEPLTRIPRLLNENIVRNTIKRQARQKRIPLSIIGETLSTREASGVLDLYKEKYKIENENKKLTKKREEGKITMEEHMKTRKILLETKQTIETAIKDQIEEYNKYAEIQKNYEKKENE